MEITPMKRKLLITVGIGTFGMMLMVFQNCGENPELIATQPGGVQAKTERIIGEPTTFEKVTYSPDGNTGAGFKMQLELSTGQMSVAPVDSASAKSCALDDSRLQSLRTLLTNARVCEPGPLPDGMASCMAVSVADIELSDGAHSTSLRPTICHNGVFLCQDKDADFRKILEDLRQNPPSGC